MALAAARRAEQQECWRLLSNQASPDGQRHHLRLRDHRHGLEVEVGERLAGRQSRLGEMPLDATTATVGHLVLGKRRQEARCRPAFLVGLRGELGPHQLDARQAQFAQQQLDAGGINRVDRRSCHDLQVGGGLDGIDQPRVRRRR